MIDPKKKVIHVPHMYTKMPETTTIDEAMRPAKVSDKAQTYGNQDTVKHQISIRSPKLDVKVRDLTESMKEPSPPPSQPVNYFDSKSSKVVGKKPYIQPQYDAMISRSHDPEAFAHQAAREAAADAPATRYYRQAGKPERFDQEADRNLFKIDVGGARGPPELRYKMNCRPLAHPRQDREGFPISETRSRNGPEFRGPEEGVARERQVR